MKPPLDYDSHADSAPVGRDWMTAIVQDAWGTEPEAAGDHRSGLASGLMLWGRGWRRGRCRGGRRLPLASAAGVAALIAGLLMPGPGVGVFGLGVNPVVEDEERQPEHPEGVFGS
jgi:hypothetical protein